MLALAKTFMNLNCSKAHGANVDCPKVHVSPFDIRPWQTASDMRERPTKHESVLAQIIIQLPLLAEALMPVPDRFSQNWPRLAHTVGNVAVMLQSTHSLCIIRTVFVQSSVGSA